MSGRIGLCAALLSLGACSGGSAGAPGVGAAHPTDTWVRFFRADTAGFVDLPATDFVVVADDLQTEAQALLETERWVVLTPEQIRHFRAERLDAIAPDSPTVLLRAVVTLGGAQGNGMRVSWRSGTALVRTFSDSTRLEPQGRRAILAKLPAEPDDAYAAAYCVITEGLDGR